MDALSGEPSGEKAVTWMAAAAQKASRASLRWYGCTSTCVVSQQGAAGGWAGWPATRGEGRACHGGNCTAALRSAWHRPACLAHCGRDLGVRQDVPQLAGAKVADADAAHQPLRHQRLHRLHWGVQRQRQPCLVTCKAAACPWLEHALCLSMLACHVSRMEGFTSGPTLPVTGQWMRYKSRY